MQLYTMNVTGQHWYIYYYLSDAYGREMLLETLIWICTSIDEQVFMQKNIFFFIFEKHIKN